MSIQQAAADVRLIHQWYLEAVADLAHEITEDRAEDEVREALDLASVPLAELREAHAEVDAALVRWFVAHGRPKIKTGDLVWRVGKKSTVEVADRKAMLSGVVEILEEETGVGLAEEERADWIRVLDVLVGASGIKHGAFARHGDESRRSERWKKAFRKRWSEIISVKSAPEGIAG